MFAVFTDSEILLMRQWIVSLATSNSAPSDDLSAVATGNVKLVEQKLIEKYGFAPAHKSENLSVAVDVFARKQKSGAKAHSAGSKIALFGQHISLNDLLQISDGYLIAAALKEANLGKAMAQSLQRSGPMRNVFGGKKEQILKWIDEGMPLE